ncbi:MAG TPA: alpha-N-acetylglucosaminidase N-terminal domain-containing protein, partial [Flavisolibacter sp.]|nr:alpha-N-acetylglucosaminidase N-terminal domain-containing protein [Flavisolibacter sp.]
MQQGIKNALFILFFLGSLLFASAGNKQAGDDEKEEAVYALIKRVVPGHARYFVVSFIEKKGDNDVFEVESVGNKIMLRGNNGIAIASALNYYLENIAHCSITWNGTNLKLPHPLPAVKEKVRKETPYKYRYYLNYCTFNYTMSWWNWDRWQK